ncbi:MAG: hypothetical protein AAF388_15785, partial [Bacteroidota bacterium]
KKRFIRFATIPLIVIFISSVLLLVQQNFQNKSSKKNQYKNFTERTYSSTGSYDISITIEPVILDSTGELLNPKISSLDTPSLNSRIESLSLSDKLNESLILEYVLEIDNTGSFSALFKSYNNKPSIPDSDKKLVTKIQREIECTKFIPAYHSRLMSYKSTDAKLRITIIYLR